MKKQLDIMQRQKLETSMEELMQTSKTVANPALKKKTAKMVLKLLDEYDVSPFGYRTLPLYLKE
jgi:hypothetical protein